MQQSGRIDKTLVVEVDISTKPNKMKLEANSKPDVEEGVDAIILAYLTKILHIFFSELIVNGIR